LVSVSEVESAISFMLRNWRRISRATLSRI
jgi:hypothetical protein